MKLGRFPCRTAALGGHLERCNTCGFPRITCNSCRNRHFPSFLGTAGTGWLNRQGADLLPVANLHVVFTLPEPLRHLALRNKRVVYGILFRAVSETLCKVFRGKFLHQLKAARRRQRPEYHGGLDDLNDDQAGEQLLNSLAVSSS